VLDEHGKARFELTRKKRRGLLKQLVDAPAEFGSGLISLAAMIPKQAINMPLYLSNVPKQDRNIGAPLDIMTWGMFTEGEGPFERFVGKDTLIPTVLSGFSDLEHRVTNPTIYARSLRGQEGYPDLIPMLLEDVGNVAIVAGPLGAALGKGATAASAGSRTASAMGRTARTAQRISRVGGEVADLGLPYVARRGVSRLLPEPSAASVAEAAARGKLPSVWAPVVEGTGRRVRSVFERAPMQSIRARLRSKYPRLLSEDGRAVVAARRRGRLEAGMAARQIKGRMGRAALAPDSAGGALSPDEQGAITALLAGDAATLNALSDASGGFLTPHQLAEAAVPKKQRSVQKSVTGELHPEYVTPTMATLASRAARGLLPDSEMARLNTAVAVLEGVIGERTAVRQAEHGLTPLDESQIDVRPSPMPIDEVVQKLADSKVITFDEQQYLKGRRRAPVRGGWVPEGLSEAELRQRRTDFYESDPRFMETNPALLDPTLYAAPWRRQMAYARAGQELIAQRNVIGLPSPSIPQTPMQLGARGVKPHYVPGGREVLPTVGLDRTLNTRDTLQGRNKARSEHQLTAEYPLGPVTFEGISERLIDEASRAENNHAYNVALARGGTLGDGYGWDGTGTPPDVVHLNAAELKKVYDDARDLFNRVGGDEKVLYDKVLVEAMAQKGWEPWPKSGSIGRDLQYGDVARQEVGRPVDIDGDTPWLRYGLREAMAPYETPRVPGLVLSGLSKVNRVFKGVQLAPSVRWQIGDAVSHYYLSTMEGVPPRELRRNVKRAQELGGRVGDLPTKRVRGRRAPSSLRVGGNSEAAMRLLDMVAPMNLRIDNPFTERRPGARVRPGMEAGVGETVTRFQKIYDPTLGRFVDFSYRYNQTHNALRREALFLAGLDRRLRRKGFNLDDPDTLRKVADSSAVTHPELHHEVVQALERTNKILGDTDALAPFERDYLVHIFPFWTWTSTVSRIAAFLAAHHPARLLFTMYIGTVFANDAHPELPGYLGTFLGPGGYWPTAYMNPFADISGLPGMDEGEIGPGSLLRSTSPGIKLAGALLGFDIGQGALLSRPPGTNRRGPWGGESYTPLIPGDLGAALYQTATAIPYGKRLINILPKMTIPLPGSDITTGNVQRYDTGESTGLPGGTPLISRIGALAGLPLPLSRERAEDIERSVAERRAEWDRRARARRKARARRQRLTSDLPLFPA